MYFNYDTMLTYKGHTVVDYAKKNPLVGDVCFKNNKIYLYTSENKWEYIDTTSTYDPIYYTKIDFRSNKLKPKICIHCGAPFHNNKCEYCGVEYY